MSIGDEHLVWIDMKNPPAGRIDRSRMGKHNRNDTETRLVITAQDIEATRRLAAAENWPRIRDLVDALSRGRKKHP
jgi:hypothetical protein